MILYDHERILTNGVNLHVVMAGPEDGEPIILLHGFPEFWYGWRNQIDYLAERGYRVIVPDQRGYNTSDKPQGIAAYNMDELTDDLMGLIDMTGREKVYLVGHDWGGAVAWWAANKYPERLKKLVALNIPHHAAMRRMIETNPQQRRKSWYMFFFQIPWLPEAITGANSAEGLARTVRSTSNAGTFTDEDLVEYRQAWTQPGEITATINWYRAIMQTPPKRLPSPRIHVPTLILWGKEDTALEASLAQASAELCDDARVVYFDNVTHWIQHEAAQAVNEHIVEFMPISAKQA